MVKLIIWDLDDTLWRGTLADAETIEPHAGRCAMVRAFNARGVVSSICSKNDADLAKEQLVKLDLWDEFVFPHIAFEPKSHGVASIISDMQLRPSDVLFVDDNEANLQEVRFHIPEITVLNIGQPGADDWLTDLLARQEGGASRVEQYRLLERKKADRAAASQVSDEAFLRSCEIEVMTPFLMENLDFVERIAELVNRSNQLNYTKSRTTADALRASIIDVLTNISLAVWAKDRYGDHGLVGFVMLTKVGEAFHLVHFVFSCRVMHMGLEQYARDEVVKQTQGLYPPINPESFRELEGRFSHVAPDWITTTPYSDPDNRSKVLSRHATLSLDRPDTRIMYNCQSAGLAHYSRRRSHIEYDSVPNVFSLKSFCERSVSAEPFPGYLVYGAGTDYNDGIWAGLEGVLESGLYDICAERLCQFVELNGLQLLVVLPPEHLRPDQYHPWMGHTLARTISFNNVWRKNFNRHSGLSLLDVTQVHGPEGMKDVNHHYPSSLLQIAGLIDTWYAQVSATPEAAAVEAQRLVA